MLSITLKLNEIEPYFKVDIIYVIEQAYYNAHLKKLLKTLKLESFLRKSNLNIDSKNILKAKRKEKNIF